MAGPKEEILSQAIMVQFLLVANMQQKTLGGLLTSRDNLMGGYSKLCSTPSGTAAELRC
jgi:hypothetical protein